MPSWFKTIFEANKIAGKLFLVCDKNSGYVLGFPTIIGFNEEKISILKSDCYVIPNYSYVMGITANDVYFAKVLYMGRVLYLPRTFLFLKTTNWEIK